MGEEGDGGEDGGEQELDGQDGIDFADELHADVERSFGDGPAELEIDGVRDHAIRGR